eukprot:11948395-Karenia_brevis.AAC.1
MRHIQRQFKDDQNAALSSVGKGVFLCVGDFNFLALDDGMLDLWSGKIIKRKRQPDAVAREWSEWLQLCTELYPGPNTRYCEATHSESRID